MELSLRDIAPSLYWVTRRWPHANNISSHYAELERAYIGGGSSVIELVKSFIDMTCITILEELNVKLEDDSPPTTYYVTQTLSTLGLKNSRGGNVIDKVLSAHNKLADALAEVRNSDGSIAHGKDGFFENISRNHLRLYILSADTILSLIMEAYDGIEPDIGTTREPYERYQHHNQRIDKDTTANAEVSVDGSIEVEILIGNQDKGTGRFIYTSVSEILFALDRQYYKELVLELGSYVPLDDSEDEN